MMDADSEQLFHDLEQRHLLLRKEHDIVCIERDTFTDKLGNLQSTVDQLRKELALSQSEVQSKEHALEVFQRQSKTLEDSSEEIHDRYRRRSEECDRLRDDVKHQSEELTTAQRRLRDCQIALSDAQGQLLPAQYDLSKAGRERDLFEAQAKELLAAQSARAIEVLDMRRVSSSKISELESAWEEARAETQETKERLKVLQDRVSIQDERINSYLGKIDELETTAGAERGSSLKELEGLKRIGDLYKRHFEEATEEVKRLEDSLAQASETGAKQIALLRESLSALGKVSEETRMSEKASLEAKISELERKLQDELLSRGLVTIGSPVSHAPVSSAESADFSLEGFSAVEMYNRVAATERELSLERSKRKEADLYLNRILRDMERNAPVLLGQKRDLNRVLESHGHLTARLDELGAENAALRKQSTSALERAKALEEDACALTQHNSDLGGQIQYLLRKAMEGQGQGQGSHSRQVALIEFSGESSSAQGVISEHLLTFQGIEELQKRNAQLLMVVRKLSADQERSEAEVEEAKASRRASAPMTVGLLENGDGEGGSPLLLQAAMKELVSLRETRERTEEMVRSLMQQRDLYKAMLDEADITVAARSALSQGRGGGAGASSAMSTPGSMSMGKGASHDSNGSPMEITSGSHRALSQELQRRLTESEEEKTKIKERANRLEEAEKMLHERLEKSLSDSITLRVEMAQSSSEARFQRERCERLESGLEEMRLQLSTSSQRRLDMERMLAQQQEAGRSRDGEILRASEALRAAQDASRRSEIEAEVSKAAESRLLTQLKDAREEVRRQASLSDSVSRIEAGLSSRVEEEKANLVQERDGAMKAIEIFRKQVAERTVIDDQRMRSLEDDLRAARASADTKAQEATSARESLVREQGLCAAALERAALSERQLAIAQDRLGTLLGSSVIDSVVAAESAQRDVALERALAEVDSLQTRLAEAEKHTEQFRLLGVNTEGMLKELRERTAVNRAAQEEEIARLKSESENLRSELDSRQGASMTQEQELEKMRDELRGVQREGAEKVRELDGAVAAAQQAAQMHAQQFELLKGDVLKFQAAARAAHGSYERELQLHAKAERDLSDAETEMDILKTALYAAQHTAADLTAATIRHERALQEERAKVAQATSENKEQMESLRSTNDILHGQVQSLGIQVSRLQESRAAVTLTVGQLGVSSTASTSALPEAGQSEVENILRPSPPTERDPEELNELRKTASELREVVRYMKRERDILEARQSVAEGEASRLESTLSVTQRALDEARGELKKELDSRVSVRGAEEFNRLTAEVTQLNLMRESNAHLRRENEELVHRVTAANEQVKALKDSAVPVEQQSRKAKAEIEALQQTNTQLSQDANYWRDRLHQLVSRYNDVDPGEHRLLEAKFQETEKALVECQLALQTLQATAAQHTEALTQKDKEIAALKNTSDSADKIATGIRQKLRDNKLKYDEMQKKLSESIRTGAESAQELKTLQLRLATAENALKVAKTRAANAAASNSAAIAAVTAAALSPPLMSSIAAVTSAPPASTTTPAASAPAPVVVTATPAAVTTSVTPTAATPTTAKTPVTDVPSATGTAPVTVSGTVVPSTSPGSTTALSASAVATTPANTVAMNRKRPGTELTASVPASSVRFPTSTATITSSAAATTATTAPVSASITADVPVAETAGSTSVSASVPQSLSSPTVSNESSMREMLLKKRQAQGLQAASLSEPLAKRAKPEETPVTEISAPVIMDLTEEFRPSEVLPATTTTQEGTVDPSLPASTSSSSMPVSVPDTEVVAMEVVPAAETETPAVVVSTGSTRGLSGLFPPTGAKSPFGTIGFSSTAAGTFAAPVSTFGSGIATSQPSGFNTAKAAAPQSGPFSFGASSFTPQVFGSGALKKMGSASFATTGIATPSVPAKVNDADVGGLERGQEREREREFVHSEESQDCYGSDRGDGEDTRGEQEREEGGDVESGGAFFEEESQSHSVSSSASFSFGSAVPSATSTATSAFGALSKASSFLSTESTGIPAAFGSMAPAAASGSSFGKATPFFLKSSTASTSAWGMSAAPPRQGSVFGVGGDVPLPASLLKTITPTPSSTPTPGSTSISAPADVAASVPVFGSGNILSVTANPFAPLIESASNATAAAAAAVDVSAEGVDVRVETGVTDDETAVSASERGTHDGTTLASSPPVATSATVVPTPTAPPLRVAAGRKPKPKPAHLTGAIPAYAQVQTRTGLRSVGTTQKERLQSLLQQGTSPAVPASASASSGAAVSAASVTSAAPVTGGGTGGEGVPATATGADTAAKMMQLRAARFSMPAATGGKKGSVATGGMPRNSSSGTLEGTEDNKEEEDNTMEEGQEQ